MSALAVLSANDVRVLRMIAACQDNGQKAADPSHVRRALHDMEPWAFHHSVAWLIKQETVIESVSGSTWKLYLTTDGWDTLTEADEG